MNRLKILPLIVLPSFSVFAAESHLVCIFHSLGQFFSIRDHAFEFVVKIR